MSEWQEIFNHEPLLNSHSGNPGRSPTYSFQTIVRTQPFNCNELFQIKCRAGLWIKTGLAGINGPNHRVFMYQQIVGYPLESTSKQWPGIWWHFTCTRTLKIKWRQSTIKIDFFPPEVRQSQWPVVKFFRGGGISGNGFGVPYPLGKSNPPWIE